MKSYLKILLSVTLLFLLFSCQPHAYKKTNKQYKKQAKAYGKQIAAINLQDTMGYATPEQWVGTTNFSLRKPNIVIIHHTAQNSCEQTLRTFTLPRTQVSAHYVICKDGTVHHMLNDYMRAWHAGKGRWGNDIDINSSSIGIEIDNNGREPFTESQMKSLETLLAHLKKTYKIPTHNFIGHADIAPTRKVDPNINFDWERIAKQGYGLWYDVAENEEVPTNFNPMHALKMIGYDISDSLAVTSSFKRKFLRKEDRKPFTEEALKVLYALMQESLKY